MGAQMQRGVYSRVCGASTAKRPAALGYAGAGPAQGATGAQPHVRVARRQDPRNGGLLLLGRVLAVKLLAEFDELALEGLEAVGDRVGDVGVVHRRLGQALLPLPLDDPTGDADDRGVWRDQIGRASCRESVGGRVGGV